MSDGSGGEREGLWGGRFEGRMAPEMIPLNRSLDLDARFWRQDVRGSRAWARALGGAGVLDQAEVEALLDGLDGVEARLEGADFSTFRDEDVHSLVERLLFEEAGEVAGKLHTGRSRNDQASTDVRLWGMERGGEVDAALDGVCRALLETARRSRGLILPGYTHLQQAQPVRAAHWALSHFWPLMRDRKRVARAVDAAATLPLGAGAIAGCPFPVDRERLRAELGFRRISENSMDAVGDRDWIADFCYAGAMIGVHLSRLAEDLVLFGSSEFGFLELSDGYSTGSSLMPQKRNPDLAELTRGKSARLVGNLSSVMTLLKGLATSYNRDLQEDKPPLFDTVDTLLLTLPAVAGAVATARFRPGRIREALDPRLLATDLADHLVRRGVPFRTSHDLVGAVVRKAEEEGVPLSELPVEAFREVHEAFGDDVHRVFDWERSVDARDVPGGTAGPAVGAQIEEAEERLAGWTEGGAP